MSERVRWVSRTSELIHEVAQMEQGPLCVDSEADSFHHYREQVCLIQVSFAERDLLIDPLAEIDLSPLQPVFRDGSIRKILHGADYDLRVLHRDCSLEIRGLFDTMLAARLVGEPAFGLSALLDKHLGVRLDKRYQRADWSQRPLSREMEEYAVMDTRYLQVLAGKLESELERLGRREWAEEEFARLERVRWNAGKTPEQAYLRVRGHQRLDRRDLAVLRELYTFRDGIARRRDVPSFRVMRDEALMQLVRVKPRDSGELASVPALPRSWSSGRGYRRIVEAIERGLAVPEDRLPQRPVRPRRRRDPAMESRVRRLCRLRDEIAEGLGLEPSVLASRAVLEGAVKQRTLGQPPEEAVELRRWQARLLAPALEQID